MISLEVPYVVSPGFFSMILPGTPSEVFPGIPAEDPSGIPPVVHLERSIFLVMRYTETPFKLHILTNFLQNIIVPLPSGEPHMSLSSDSTLSFFL